MGGGSAAIAVAADNGPSLKVATVALGTVTQTVESSGTVTASTKQTAQFPVSGTVKSVDVAVGDKVKAGQTLALLDTTALQSAVDSVAASLAAAQQKLSADASGQVSSGSGATSGASGTSGTSGTTGVATFSDVVVSGLVDDSTIVLASASPTPTGTSAVTKAQAAVIAAQKQVDAGQTDLDAAQKTVDAAITE
ncbi:MAG: trimeric autotransporter adhesin, partial [Pseudonocardiales bacterium]|nr:trimeric autotransporter adhesin [Pseudonocardiales bacterium]